MILRKPYAFLIKHFRLIHLLLSIPIIYLIFKSNAVVSFFRSYVANNYYTNITDIAGTYINFFMYLAVLVILLGSLAIFYLMRQKKKSTHFYMWILIYYMFFFVLIGITHGVLSGMEIQMLEAKTARAYRDVSLVLVLPQYLFAFYSIFRGVGFDIKKFNFELDKKELEITETDNEEFEFQLNIPDYKIKRTVHRFFREFGYYIKENTFVFSCLCVILVGILGTFIYLNFGVYNKTYTQSEKMSHNSFTIQLEDTMLTNMDQGGNPITEGKYYLVLRLYVENKTKKNVALDIDNFGLMIGKSRLTPNLDRAEYFIDFGAAYYGKEIQALTKDSYALIYELDASQVMDNYEVKILDQIDYKVGEITPKYKILKITPNKVLSKTEEDKVSLNEELLFKESAIQNTSLKVKRYEISDRYIYFYGPSVCSNGICTSTQDIIQVNLVSSVIPQTLLILDVDYQLDTSTVYGSHVLNPKQFFNPFLKVQFVIDGKIYTSNALNKTTDRLENQLVFQIDKRVLNASSISLLLTIRNKEYTILLKE